MIGLLYLEFRPASSDSQGNHLLAFKKAKEELLDAVASQQGARLAEKSDKHAAYWLTDAGTAAATAAAVQAAARDYGTALTVHTYCDAVPAADAAVLRMARERLAKLPATASGTARTGPGLEARTATTAVDAAPTTSPDTPSWRTLPLGAVAAVLVVAAFAAGWFARPRPAAEPVAIAADEWAAWRRSVEAALGEGELTDSRLMAALALKPPAPREDKAAVRLRHDQAVAEVFMANAPVRDLLWKRLGIDADNFLGTGLSKPNTAKDYRSAAAHEYFVPNLRDSEDGVFTWKLGLPDLGMSVETLVGNSEKMLIPMPTEIVRTRVQERNATKPAVIRFQYLDDKVYKDNGSRLGRRERYWVFTSDLSEVWTLSVDQAAAASGHTFTPGKSLYVWMFVPKNPDQVIPATWGEILQRAPQLLKPQGE